MRILCVDQKRFFLSIFFFFFPSFTYPSTFKYKEKNYAIVEKEIDGFSYFKAKELFQIFNFSLVYEQDKKTYKLNYNKHNAEIIESNPFISIDGKLLNFPLEPLKYEEELYLPLIIVNSLLESFKRESIRKEDGVFVVHSKKIALEKIAIDPGHGGKDPGAVGPTNYFEKDAVLDISLELKKLIEKNLGKKCILTREKDEFIALGERAQIANKNSCDLFISIHCNASEDARAHGCEVYFLSPAKTNWARAVEARENASLKYEGKVPEASVEYILWDMAQSEFLEESNILCKYILASLSNIVKKRFVSQANFAVLRGVYMPAALVEVEFISNRDVEKKLKDKKFKENIARQIFEGIKAYNEYYEKKMGYE